MHFLLGLMLLGFVSACSASRDERLRSQCVTSSECLGGRCEAERCVSSNSASVIGRVEGAPPQAAPLQGDEVGCDPGEDNGIVCRLAAGGAVTLMAMPLAGYRFDGWGGAPACASREPMLQLTGVQEDTECVARYVRRFAVRGASEGASVNLDASSASASALCNGAACEIDGGESVTLWAPSVAGYRLEGFRGEGCERASGDSALARNVQADVTCTARYVPGVAVGGSVENAEGEVLAASASPGASCADGRCTIDEGGQVTLTAPPLAGRTFVGWSGDEGCSGTNLALTLSDVRTSKSCRAVFAARHRVEGRAQPATSGSVIATSGAPGARCEGAGCELDQGGSAMLIASPAPGARFLDWSGGGACAGALPTLTLRDVGASLSCVANFVARLEVAGEVSPEGAGQVTASSPSNGAECSGESCSVDPGGSVSLRAVPLDGYRFDGWTGCGPSAGELLSLSNLSSDRRCVAAFVRQYELTGASVPADGGSTSCSEGCLVDEGASATVSARANTGYRFLRWQGCAAGAAPELALADVRADLHCEAVYELIVQ